MLLSSCETDGEQRQKFITVLPVKISADSRCHLNAEDKGLGLVFFFFSTVLYNTRF